MSNKALFSFKSFTIYVVFVLATILSVKAQPVINRFYPASASSGKTVTIEGSGFTSATLVSLGGIPVQSFSVVNDTAIRAIVAGGASGEVKVTSGGQTASMAGFIYLVPIIDSIVQVGSTFSYRLSIFGKHFGNAENIQLLRIAGYTINSFSPGPSDTLITILVNNQSCLDDSVIVQTKYHRLAIAGLSCKPRITLRSLFPQRAKEGDTINITGTNFEDIIRVTVGGLNALSYQVINDTLIRAVAGKGTAFFVEVVSKSSYANIFGYTYGGLQTKRVEPMGGRGGDIIRLTGQLFSSVTDVRVAGTPVQQFQILSDSVILATLNAGGKGAVEVISANGSHSLQGFNSIIVNQISPRVGMPGDTVTFNGRNLRFVNSASFGSSPASDVTVFGDTLVKIIVPAIPTVNDGKLKLFSLYDTLQVMNDWKFALPATIIDFSPKAARYTDTVTIRGTHLATSSSVRSGNSSLGDIIFKNDTLVQVLVGYFAQSGNIRLITTGNGEAFGGAFTFLPIPTISSISPIPAGPTDTLEIKGKNLRNIQTARFGLNSYPITLGTLIYVSDSLLRIPIKAFYESPLRLYAGTYLVPLPSPGFQYVAKPGIDSVRPMIASEGMEVEIYGSHLDYISAISFGGVPAKSFARKNISWYETVLVAYPANGSPGLMEVTNSLGTGRYNRFVYSYKPILTKVNYTEIGAKDTIRVTGGNLDLITSVLFGGVAVKYFEAESKNLLKIVVGSGLDDGNYDLQLIGVDTVLQAGKLKYFLPEIPVFTRDTIAHPGKMIKIVGKNLIPKEGESSVEVWFGDVLVGGKPEEGDSILFLKIPMDATDINFRVVTRYAEGYFNRMQLKWPCVIDSVKPGLAEPGEMITIYGKNLSGLVNGPRLFLADLFVNPETVSDNAITFKMPLGSTGGDLRLSVNGFTEEFSDAVHGKFTAVNTTISRNRFSTQSLPYLPNPYSRNEVFHDLDNDGKPEWIRLQEFEVEGSSNKEYIIIRKNISTADSVIFAEDAILEPVINADGWGPTFKFGDLDNDGSTDILFWNTNRWSQPGLIYSITKIRLEEGTWKADTSTRRYGRSWLDAAIGDINHDGLNDILVGSWKKDAGWMDDAAVFEWYEGIHPENNYPFTHFWWPATKLLVGDRRYLDYGLPVEMTHLRNRNAPDFKLNSANYTQLTQPFTKVTSITNVYPDFAGMVTPTKMVLSDLNNDGAKDFLGFDYNYGIFGKAFWNNKSTGNNPLFNNALTFNIGALAITGIRAADFNGDGKPDIVVTSKGTHDMPQPDSIHFLERTGDINTFQFVKRSFLFTDFEFWDDDFSIMDINGDGKSDLVFTVYNSQDFSYKILLNKIGSSDEVNVCDGQDAPVLVAGKNGSSYQWQSSTGSSYVNMTDGAGVSGALTNTLQLSDLTLAQHNLKIRCVVDGVPAQGYVIKIINRWVGLLGENADWHNPANWSCGIVPNETTNVMIDGAEVNINSDAACSSLELRNNARVNANSNIRLTIMK